MLMVLWLWVCVFSVPAVPARAAPAPSILDVNDSGVTALRPKEIIRPIEDLQNAGSEHNSQFGGVGGRESKYGDEDDGFYRSKANKGSKGYKHFDSYHKKDGDKWAHMKNSGHGGKKNGDDKGSYFQSTSYSYDSNDDQDKKSEPLIVEEHSDEGGYDGDGDHDRYDDGQQDGGEGYHDDHDSDSYHQGYHDGDDDRESYHDDQIDESPMHNVGSNLGSSAFRGGGGTHPSGYYNNPASGGATSYYIRHY